MNHLSLRCFVRLGKISQSIKPLHWSSLLASMTSECFISFLWGRRAFSQRLLSSVVQNALQLKLFLDRLQEPLLISGAGVNLTLVPLSQLQPGVTLNWSVASLSAEDLWVEEAALGTSTYCSPCILSWLPEAALLCLLLSLPDGLLQPHTSDAQSFHEACVASAPNFPWEFAC